jgi:transposase-like protein
MKELTKKQLHFLKNHKLIERITSKQVIFSFEFKLKAVTKYIKGISVIKIFEEENLGFLPRKMMTNSVVRWRDKYHKEGEKGLLESKKGPKPLQSQNNSELSYEELIAKVEYLEQENDFLKKLKALRKGQV